MRCLRRGGRADLDGRRAGSVPRTLNLYVILLAFAVVIGTVQPAAATTNQWRPVVRSRMLTNRPLPVGPYHRGDSVSAAVLNSSGGILAPQYTGRTGWATAFLDGYLYPMLSKNRGNSWHIGGRYLAKPDAPSRDYVSSIKVLTPMVVAMYARNGYTLDVTRDGGRTWYQAIFFPALITRVWGSRRLFTHVDVESDPNVAVRHGVYGSQDVMKLWRLGS